MKTLLFAPAIAGALASAASATAQSAQFNVTSAIFAEGDAIVAVSDYSNAFGLLEADADFGPLGYARTDVVSSSVDLTISSAIGMLLGAEGYALDAEGYTLGSGRFTIDGTLPILVNWNWSSVAGLGGWSILDSNGVQVAALSFVNGAYQSSGGSFGESTAGSALVNLAAGSYTMRSLFVSSGAAENSMVNFTFAPAPGALALLGAAGLVGTRRRR